MKEEEINTGLMKLHKKEIERLRNTISKCPKDIRAKLIQLLGAHLT